MLTSNDHLAQMVQLAAKWDEVENTKEAWKLHPERKRKQEKVIWLEKKMQREDAKVVRAAKIAYWKDVGAGMGKWFASLHEVWLPSTSRFIHKGVLWQSAGLQPKSTKVRVEQKRAAACAAQEQVKIDKVTIQSRLDLALGTWTAGHGRIH
jgi:hypothetical protein